MKTTLSAVLFYLACGTVLGLAGTSWADKPGVACPAGCNEQQQREASEPPVSIPDGNSPSIGPSNAPVTIVEFTDYECPFCRRADQTLKALRERYGSQIRIVVKQNPLPFHKHAEAAAHAALAAAIQGRFEPMHEKLFEHQNALNPQALAQYAQEVGLDSSSFLATAQGSSVEQELKDDAALARTLKVSGTPHFFINGKRLVGAQPMEVFVKRIDDALAHRD